MYYGYHFTTLENWTKILKKGYIKPYQIKNDTVKLPFDIKGVWIWERCLSREELLGCCIFQFFKKGALSFVNIEVPYEQKSNSILFANKTQYYTMDHNYLDCPLNLHVNVPAVVGLNKIKIEEFRQVEYFHLVDCIPHKIGEILNGDTV